MKEGTPLGKEKKSGSTASIVECGAGLPQKWNVIVGQQEMSAGNGTPIPTIQPNKRERVWQEEGR